MMFSFLQSYLRMQTMACVLLATGMVGAARAQEQTYDVPFLTLRNLSEEGGPGPYFGDARSTLRAGNCRLSEVDTGGLAPVLDNGPTFLREQLLRIDQVTVESADNFLNRNEKTWSGPPAVYVHGYYIDFEKGCRRAALLQSNAQLGGRMTWFTWPSDGDIANYAPDEADLYWSVPDIAAAIVDVHRRAGANGPADVIGHSLGGRGVALALKDIAFRHPDVRLGHVVLLAPDMDFEIFARMLPDISPMAESITVYVTSDDRPLALSSQFHGYARLGQSGNDVTRLPGVEVIDVSAVPSESASGHLYHIHSDHVGRDLDQLLNSGLRAQERTDLIQAGPNLWRLVPN